MNLQQQVKSQVSRFNVDRVLLADFVAVAAGADWVGVTDGPHMRGVCPVPSQMVCGAGRWLREVALKIRCAGEHVLVSTKRLRTMWQLVVVGCAGEQLPHVVSCMRDCVVSRECACQRVAQRCGQGRHLPRRNSPRRLPRYR